MINKNSTKNDYLKYGTKEEETANPFLRELLKEHFKPGCFILGKHENEKSKFDKYVGIIDPEINEIISALKIEWESTTPSSSAHQKMIENVNDAKKSLKWLSIPERKLLDPKGLKPKTPNFNIFIKKKHKDDVFFAIEWNFLKKYGIQHQYPNFSDQIKGNDKFIIIKWDTYDKREKLDKQNKGISVIYNNKKELGELIKTLLLNGVDNYCKSKKIDKKKLLKKIVIS